MIHTFLDGHAALFLGRLDLIPEHHPHLAVFERSRDVHFAILLQIFDRLWRLLPALLERSHGQSATFARLTLNLGQKRGLIAHVEVVLRIRGL